MEQKVLFAASTYHHIKSYLLPYMGEFQKAGWQIHVACGDAPGAIFYASQVITLPMEETIKSRANTRAAHLLHRKIEQECYDLIITHSALTSYITRLALSGLKKRPRLINVSYGYPFDDTTGALKRRSLLKIERKKARFVDLVMTMNQYDYRVAQRYRLGKQVFSIPGIGIDFSLLRKPDRTEVHALRQNLDLKAGDLVLLCADVLSSRGSQSVLIRALPLLPKSVILLLSGKGSRLAECKKLAEKLGVADRVRFPNTMEKMTLWYSVSDVIVTAAQGGEFSPHIMEAMYMGLPVVASAVKGLEDFIVDNDTGLLYPYGNHAAFADRILKLYESPALCEWMGQNAHRSVLPYSLDQVLPQVIGLYGLTVSDDDDDE